MGATKSNAGAPVFSLEGKIIVLTGAAGLYGRCLSAQLAGAGATLVLASRNLLSLERIATILLQRGYAGVHVFSYDQDREDSVLVFRDWVLARFGRIDGLVNNAVARPMRSFASPLAEWEASMKTNATGLFCVIRAFGESMARNNGGSIVNIGSIQGMVGPDLALYEGLDLHTIPDYFFHKAGMVNLTRYFAAHYGPEGVRVNCVSPGGFHSGQPPVFVERYTKATFLRRMAGESDLGGPVVFLLSDASRYVTGINLPVDGGYTAH